MKNLISFLILLVALSASAQRTIITVTVTNRAVTGDGVTNGGTFRYFTNVTTATTIATNLTSINATKSNLYSQIASSPYAGQSLENLSTNSFRLTGNGITMAISGTWGYLTTNVTGTNPAVAMVYPIISLADSNRANQASDMVLGIDAYATNRFGTNYNGPLSNYLNKGASPQQYVAGPVQFNGLLRAGAGGGVTNLFVSGGTNVNGRFSNIVNFGNAIRSEGSGGNSFQAGSNAVAAGNQSIAVGNGALASNVVAGAIGTLAKATNDYALAVGYSALAGGYGSTAIGNASDARALQSLAVGMTAFARGDNASAVGTAATAYENGQAFGLNSGAYSNNALAVGLGALASQVNASAIGYSAYAIHDYSTAIGGIDFDGNQVETTTSNQVRVGTSAQVLSVPGFISGTLSNLLTASGQTNRIEGDLSTPRATVTTIANGANTFSMGTNVVLDLTGSPSAAWTVDGIKFGTQAPRDGHRLWLKNSTGYDATFVANSGLEPTAAYRISTTTSTNIIFTNGATAELIYFASSARWQLWNVFDGHEPSLTATATNAISSITTNGSSLAYVGTLLTNIQWNTGVTGYLSGATAILGVNVSSGAASTQMVAAAIGTLTATNGGTINTFTSSVLNAQQINVSGIAATNMTNLGLAYFGTNGIVSDSGAPQWQLKTRSDSLVTTQPVPYFIPTTDSTPIAFDIMPKGTVNANYLGAGVAWIDVVREDVAKFNVGGYHALRMAMTTNMAVIASVAGTTNQYPLSIVATNIVMSKTNYIGNNGIGVVEIIGTTLTPTTRPYGGLVVTDDTPMAADKGGVIAFQAQYTSAGAYTDMAALRSGKDNATSGQYGGYLALHTRTDGSGNDTERVRISSTGNVTVPTGGIAATNNIHATNSFLLSAWPTAPAGLAMQGAQIWSDGTNLLVTLRNSGGTITTNKLTMSAWP